MTTALDTVRYECGIAGEEIADMVDSLEKENDQLREHVAMLRDLVNVKNKSLEILVVYAFANGSPLYEQAAKALSATERHDRS